MKKRRTPAAERLLRARKAASKELKLPVTDWRTRRFALLMVAHDNVTARFASGTEINVDNLTKLDDQMQAIRSSVPQEPLTVTVTFVPPRDAAPPDAAAVDGLVECRRCHWKPDGSDRVSKCYRCGWTHGADVNAPWSPPLLASPVRPEPKALSAPAAAETKPPVEAKPEAKKPLWADTGYVPAQNFHKGTLKRDSYADVAPLDGGLGKVIW